MTTYVLRLVVLLCGVTAATAQIAVPGERVRRPAMIGLDNHDLYRVHGKVTAIDRASNTVTISANGTSKPLHFIHETAIIKSGGQAKLNDVILGDEADGIVGMVQGKLTPISFRFGPFQQLPSGIPVAGQPSAVRSPYNPKGGIVDVSGMPAGIEVKDPYSSKVFLVPK